MAENDHYKYGLAKKRKPQTQAIRDKFADMVPTTWLDPLLTGDKAVIGHPPQLQGYRTFDVAEQLRNIAPSVCGAAKVVGIAVLLHRRGITGDFKLGLVVIEQHGPEA